MLLLLFVCCKRKRVWSEVGKEIDFGSGGGGG